MTEYEWKQRARMQFARKNDDINYDWDYIANVCHEVNLENFKRDPEGAADKEMSNWQ